VLYYIKFIKSLKLAKNSFLDDFLCDIYYIKVTKFV